MGASAPLPASSPLVVWDMDEVLANLRDRLCQALALHAGVECDWRTWTSLIPLHDLAGLTPAELDDLLVKAGVLETCDPEPGAVEVLARYHHAGARQVIITARGWHPRAVSVTRGWLERHDMLRYVTELVVVPLDACKATSINALDTPAALYVEDAPHHATAARDGCEVGLIALRDRPWNRHVVPCPQLVRITDLRDLPPLP